MSRGLTANQIGYLDDNATIHETLVQITYNGNSVYYTTGMADISVATDTSGGTQTFVTANDIKSVDQVPEVPFGAEIRVGMLLTGDFTQNLGALGVTALELPNIDTAIYIHKVFRNVSDYTLWSENPIKLFQGVLTKKTYTVGATLAELQLEIVSKTQFQNKKSVIKLPKGLGAR